MLTRRLSNKSVGPSIHQSERRSLPSNAGRELIAKYTLNETKTLHKKREACDRENYTITHHDFCATVVFNTVAFEVFRKNLTNFYDGNQKYSTTLDEIKDQIDRTTQDTIKVHDRTRRNTPHIYTINLYRTTCRVMVNGPHHLHFINNDLPGITDTIDKMEDRLRIMNSQVKLKLTVPMVSKLSSPPKDCTSKTLRLCGKETDEPEVPHRFDSPEESVHKEIMHATSEYHTAASSKVPDATTEKTQVDQFVFLQCICKRA